MGGHAARRDNKQKALEKLNLARRAATKATLAKQKPPAKAKKTLPGG